ncbi:MAG: DNA helicase RecQ [Bacteroidales bacterium]|nr:DNA helicase RecQ [Bacteroidales bacterium]
MNLEQPLEKYLKKYFGFDRFKGLQKEIIENVLSGNDSFVLMPTGGGKSLTYQLPAILMEGTAIIISPLIALMKNQVDSIRGYSQNDEIAFFLNSSLSKGQINEVKQNIIAGKAKMLYVAPESLTKQDNIDFLKNIKISFYAVDEAHCISEWGHDFRPEYRKIRAMVEEISREPIIALTATATPKVQNDIQKNLGILDSIVFKASFFRSNLYYEVRPKIDTERQIIKFIVANKNKSGIIYCLSRKKVEELSETLVVNGIKALPYHAGMDAATRAGNQDKFLMEEADVIVATIAFGMGIDKPDVRFVIHYDIPKSLEGYYQETGRGGRDGGEGKCIAFYSYKDIQKLEKFMQNKPVAEQEIGRQLLLETVAYAETSLCRPRILLNYFGEELKKDCGNCDNCLHPKKQFEGKEYVQLVIEAVIEVKELFKAEHISTILAGKTNATIKSYKHTKLDVFGKGYEKDIKFWNMVLRHTLIAKLLSKDIENYGILKLTKKGKAFFEKPQTFLLTKDHNFDEDQESQSIPQGGSAGSSDPQLFAMLRELRKQISKKKNLPPFVIFQDISLEDMSTQYPISIEEMQNITGVGQGKARKFGKDFVELIKLYVEENEIERAQDLIVKSVVKKSGMKVYIIHSIDRKIALTDITDAKGLEMKNLLTEVEAIVNSGTKLNIDYYIDQVMDADHQNEVFEYFRESNNDSLQEALDELGEDEYTEEDIRLLRIKFISEMGH